MKSTGFCAADTRLVGNVSERPVAVVVIQNVAPILSHVKIGKTVIVITAPDATQTVAGSGNSGLLRDVGECAVAVVAVKRIAHGNATVVQITTIDEIDVLPAYATDISYIYSRAMYIAIARDDLITLYVDILL